MNPSLAEGERGLLLCAYQDLELSGRGSTAVFNVMTGDWQPVGTPGGASSGRDWWPKIAFGPNSEVYRINYDYGLGARLGFRRLEVDPQLGPIWTLPLGSELSTGEAHTPDIELGAGNRPIVSFQDGPGGNTLSQSQGGITVLRIDMATGQSTALGGAGFSDAFVPAGQRSSVWHTQVELAPDGEIFAAWDERWDGHINHQLHVARYSEASDEWTLLGAPGLGQGAGGVHLNLQLLPSGIPVVAYRGQSPRALRVQRWVPETTEWVQIGGDVAVDEFAAQTGDVGFSSDAGYRESVPFVIDDEGRMFIACRAHDASGHLRLKTWEFKNGEWQPMGALGGFLPGSGEEDYAHLIAVGGRLPVISCRRSPNEPGEEIVVHGFF